jgi:sporulation protein YlmC with PRC-barrel domain
VSTREVLVPRLIGRRVRDIHGRSIGRIEDLICEIELREGGCDYLVREFHVGTFGALEAMTGSITARLLLRTLGRGRGYMGYRIPWEWMDLSDPERPRLDRGADELRSARTESS